MQKDLSPAFVFFFFGDLQRINFRFIANGKRLCFPMKTCQREYFLPVFFYQHAIKICQALAVNCARLETLMLGQSWRFGLEVFFRLFFPHSRVNTLWSESIQRKYAGCLLPFLLPGHRIIGNAELEETY